ncbi:hypothetical protein O3G_MSEX010998 [Manduca sexta]|uniref:EndoU domain-containing protein n=1 Tax=Manduca sexta TaxID=7130 RepID=A0A921ZKD7_MANSE|nr:hypothetical protein O3G_MSEX010998 [Manduca sexta]KAG6458710.1 hypothetical protein O3G_MSEX010998 [Manduca sexta]
MSLYLKLCVFILLFAGVTFGLEYNKHQRYNTNTDFLLHEGGVVPSGPKRDNTVSQSAAESPSLNYQINNQNNGKRDYVNQFPQLKPPSQTSRPTTQTLNPTSKAQPTASTWSSIATPAVNPQSNSGKRDYVAPQYPSLKPTQQPPGKVKDLINFYDNKANEQKPQGVPSYSSTLQGSTTRKLPSTSTVRMQTFTQTTPKPPTAKPLSFSSVVAGSNKPAQPTLATPKPTTRVPVLPSAILNNNRNTNRWSSSAPTDEELQILSEDLLKKDTNNAAKYITVNYQEKTTSQSKDDKAPLPLLTISSEVWNISTIEKFVPLLDNYERDTLVNEYVTPQERNEENAFMDAIMSTSVIRHLMNFFKDKGFVTPDPKQQRDFLKQLWFSLYSRGKGKIGSSGFEHVFVSELRNGDVSGLHNWIYFSKEETANRINYLGYLKYVQLGEKGVVMKLHFNQQGSNKPVDSMFIGTSPELEIALYTLCFVTRADNDCKLKLGGKDVEIVTHTFRYRSKNLIGSAYPQI